MIENSNAQYAKYKSCQYINVSAKTMLHAINLFNSAQEGDVDRSFSAFHKAWLLLFQADVLIKINDPISGTHSPSNGFLHECKCAKFNCGIKTCTLKKGSRIYSIEKALAYIAGEKSKVIAELPNGYKFAFGHGHFKTLNTRKEVFSNLMMVKQLRNIDQHDYMETKANSFTELMDFSRPYVIANVKNFLYTYEDIVNDTARECTNDVSQDQCYCRNLPTVQTLKNQIYFPWSYKSMFSYGEVLWEKEGQYIEGKKKLIHLIDKEREAFLEAERIWNNIPTSSQNPKTISKKKEKEKEKGHHKEALQRLEKNLSKIEKVLESNHQEDARPFSSMRKEFLDSIRTNIPKLLVNDDDQLIKIDVVPSLIITTKATEKLLDNKVHSVSLEMLNEYLSKFKFHRISEVEKALSQDTDLPPNTVPHFNKLKTYEDDIRHIEGSSYYAVFFNETRYTQKFYDFVKHEILNEFIEHHFIPIINKKLGYDLSIHNSKHSGEILKSFILKDKLTEKYYQVNNLSSFENNALIEVLHN